MKKQIVKLTSILMLTLFSAFALYAENADEEKSPWALSLTTDAAFDFKSDYVSGPTHFAPITKVYGGIEAQSHSNQPSALNSSHFLSLY